MARKRVNWPERDRGAAKRHPCAAISPLYQGLYNTGQNAALSNLAATGGSRGGNTTNPIHLGTNMLAQTEQQQLSNLGGISSQC